MVYWQDVEKKLQFLYILGLLRLLSVRICWCLQQLSLPPKQQHHIQELSHDYITYRWQDILSEKAQTNTINNQE